MLAPEPIQLSARSRRPSAVSAKERAHIDQASQVVERILTYRIYASDQAFDCERSRPFVLLPSGYVTTCLSLDIPHRTSQLRFVEPISAQLLARRRRKGGCPLSAEHPILEPHLRLRRRSDNKLCDHATGEGQLMIGLGNSPLRQCLHHDTMCLPTFHFACPRLTPEALWRPEPL